MEQSSSLPVGLALLRSARRLSRFAAVLAWLIPPVVVAQYLFFDAAWFPMPFGLSTFLVAVEWNLVQRSLAAAVALMPSLAVMFALFAVSRICREYAGGRLFSDAVLGAYRRLGLALVATTGLHWLQPTLLGAALSLTLPPGKRLISVGVSSDDLLLVLVTAVVFMLGSVMQVAQRVQSENAEII